MYFRALAARDVEVFLGQFRSGTRWMRRSEPCPRGTDCPVSEENIRVISTEEKGSDVNFASHLLIDAFRRDCKMAIVLTNDTDLVEPIRLARDDLDLHLALAQPKRQSRTESAPSTSSRSSATARCKQASYPICSATAAARYTAPRLWRPIKR